MLLFGCAVSRTMTVWDKPNITAEQRRQDNIECGATPDGPRGVLIQEAVSSRHGSCMEAKGYVRKQTQGTSTLQLGQSQSKSSIDDPEYRKSISFNASEVTVDPSCSGIFVPKLEQKLFRNVIPAWNISVLNNSTNRYSVSYDLKVKRKGATFFGSYNETTVEERTFTVRPRALGEFVVLEGKSDITAVSVDIFKCSPDGRTAR
jgi:hypothetical protein